MSGATDGSGTSTPGLSWSRTSPQKRSRVFGSVARGEDKDGSDLDILVDALPGSTLFTLGGLHSELAMIMRDVKVDLLTPGELPESIRSRVLAEAKTI